MTSGDPVLARYSRAASDAKDKLPLISQNKGDEHSEAIHTEPCRPAIIIHAIPGSTLLWSSPSFPPSPGFHAGGYAPS
ncbi:hypothetical protein LZ31DRAFT_558425 [Colletotrichum somersetense]|nr:hypothetical protein LZ31DRAFT_558425 [Colletotrichum somersetense]